MSRTTTKQKEVFTWDEERSLGFVYPEEGARKCVEVKRAKKEAKDYIVLTEWRYYKKDNEEQWNPVKGMTIPAHNWEELNALVIADLLDDPAADPIQGEDEADE